MNREGCTLTSRYASAGETPEIAAGGSPDLLGHSVSVGRRSERRQAERERWEEIGAIDAWTRIHSRRFFRRGFLSGRRGQLLIGSDIVAEVAGSMCLVGEQFYKYRSFPRARWLDQTTGAPVIEDLRGGAFLLGGERVTLERSRAKFWCFEVIELVAADGSLVLAARHLPPPKSRLPSGWVLTEEAAIIRERLPHRELVALVCFRRFNGQGPPRWPKDLRGG
jgi:hypothetical protein